MVVIGADLSTEIVLVGDLKQPGVLAMNLPQPLEIVNDRNGDGYCVVAATEDDVRRVDGVEIAVSDRQVKKRYIDLYVGKRSVRGCHIFVLMVVSFVTAEEIRRKIREYYGDNQFRLFRAVYNSMPISDYLWVFDNPAVMTRNAFQFEGAKSVAGGRKGSSEFFANVISVTSTKCLFCPGGQTEHGDPTLV